MLAGILRRKRDPTLRTSSKGRLLCMVPTPPGPGWRAFRAPESPTDRGSPGSAQPIGPGDLVLRKRLAAASAHAGDWEAAVGHLRVIAERGSPPERFAAWGEISPRFEEAGKVDDAIAAQEALLALMGPDHWQLDSARRRLLNLHKENHSLDALEQKWREEAEARPRDPLPALRMAKFYEFQTDGTQRHGWLAKAAALLPKDIRLACDVAALDLSWPSEGRCGPI